eukprot:3844225-Prymnesium_polylepis.1
MCIRDSLRVVHVLHRSHGIAHAPVATPKGRPPIRGIAGRERGARDAAVGPLGRPWEGARAAGGPVGSSCVELRVGRAGLGWQGPAGQLLRGAQGGRVRRAR